MGKEEKEPKIRTVEHQAVPVAILSTPTPNSRCTSSNTYAHISSICTFEFPQWVNSFVFPDTCQVGRLTKILRIRRQRSWDRSHLSCHSPGITSNIEISIPNRSLCIKYIEVRNLISEVSCSLWALDTFSTSQWSEIRCLLLNVWLRGLLGPFCISAPSTTWQWYYSWETQATIQMDLPATVLLVIIQFVLLSPHTTTSWRTTLSSSGWRPGQTVTSWPPVSFARGVAGTTKVLSYCSFEVSV